ncbi:hypothetical protein BJ875DRAFT_481920 [Amylocarpus encephaloides]|uniref:Uncharacterized protein n=1 Tax=Amylocarpus encephaloides TaxID=45428 RepID=A0A9P8C7Y6_9HELO|nr:hypothetical protein BJ875DRAFT_481920 [Amylocarpus encephaloides]
MLIKHSRSNKHVKMMDPDCAICSLPALAQCECEAKGLDIAVRQAEQRMMTSMLNDIRTWVRSHAQDYILSYYSMLTARRKEFHARRSRDINERAAHYYHAPPHPSEVAAVDAEFKLGIDDDWKASVQRYPEVLAYFYGLVDMSLPRDDDPGVKDPPLSALGGVETRRERKVRLREPPVVDRRERIVEREDTYRRRGSVGRDRRDRDRDRPSAPVAPPLRIPSRPQTAFGGGQGYGYVSHY